MNTQKLFFIEKEASITGTILNVFKSLPFGVQAAALLGAGYTGKKVGDDFQRNLAYQRMLRNAKDQQMLARGF